MPPKVKAVLSVFVAVVAIAAAWFFGQAGNAISRNAVLFLGPFMIVAMWIFPEVTRKEGGGRDIKGRR